MSGKSQKGRQNMRDSKLWEMNKGWWKGRWARGGGDWVTGTEGALDGMNNGCYAICWQIELQ